MKLYDLGLKEDKRTGGFSLCITEVEDGGYVSRADYVRISIKLAEMENIARWCQRRIGAAYSGYVDSMIDKVREP